MVVGREGKTPSAEGQVANVGDHDLVSVESVLPTNELVWKCKHCGERCTGTAWFADNDCQ